MAQNQVSLHWCKGLTASVGDAGAGVKLSDFRRHPRLSADTINALEPRKERRMNAEGARRRLPLCAQSSSAVHADDRLVRCAAPWRR